MIFFTILLLSINRNLIIFNKIQRSTLKNEIEIYTTVSSIIRKIRTRDVGYITGKKDIYVYNFRVNFSDEGDEVNIGCDEKGMYVNRKYILKKAKCSFYINDGYLNLNLEKDGSKILRRVKL